MIYLPNDGIYKWSCPTISTSAITLNGNVLQSSAATGNQWFNQNGLISGATNQNYTPTINGDYYTIVTVNGCSSDISNKIHIVINGIKNSAENNEKINIYPNPVTNELFIESFPDNNEKIYCKNGIMSFDIYTIHYNPLKILFLHRLIKTNKFVGHNKCDKI